MRPAATIRLALLCLLLFPILLACQPKPGSQESLAAAKKQYKERKYQEATSTLRSYIYYNPDSYEAALTLGLSFLDSARGDKDKLYLARYYFMRAANTAKNNNTQKARAMRKYHEAKALIGAKSIRPEALSKAAEQGLREGSHASAFFAFLHAAAKHIDQDDLAEAIANLRSALDSLQQGWPRGSEKTSYLDSTMLALATAHLLNENPSACKKALGLDPMVNALPMHIETLPHGFLSIAAEILSTRAKKAYPFSKATLSDEDFGKVTNLYGQLENPVSEDFPKDRLLLYGRVWRLLARHAEGLSLDFEHRKARRITEALFARISSLE